MGHRGENLFYFCADRQPKKRGGESVSDRKRAPLRKRTVFVGRKAEGLRHGGGRVACRAKKACFLGHNSVEVVQKRRLLSFHGGEEGVDGEVSRQPNAWEEPVRGKMSSAA